MIEAGQISWGPNRWLVDCSNLDVHSILGCGHTLLKPGMMHALAVLQTKTLLHACLHTCILQILGARQVRLPPQRKKPPPTFSVSFWHAQPVPKNQANEACMPLKVYIRHQLGLDMQV